MSSRLGTAGKADRHHRRPKGLVLNSCTPNVMSVLVVEDHEDTATSTVDLVRMHGHHVNSASTGRDALELAADQPPDVVLLDINLPDLNGWEVARWLREQAAGRKKRPLLVAVTGCGSADDYRQSTSVGIDFHLVKPVDPGLLVGILKRIAQTVT